MPVPEALFYVGIDWATETHAICVLTAAGRIKAQFMIDHTASGFADLLRRLGRLTGNPGDVPIGIERPDGRLVDALLEAGFPVVPVKPERDQNLARRGSSLRREIRRRRRHRHRRIPATAGASPATRDSILRPDQGVADRGPHPG